MKSNRIFKVIDEEGEKEYRFECSKARSIFNWICSYIFFGLVELKNPYKMISPKKKKAPAIHRGVRKQRPKNLA